MPLLAPPQGALRSLHLTELVALEHFEFHGRVYLKAVLRLPYNPLVPPHVAEEKAEAMKGTTTKLSVLSLLDVAIGKSWPPEPQALPLCEHRASSSTARARAVASQIPGAHVRPRESVLKQHVSPFQKPKPNTCSL